MAVPENSAPSHPHAPDVSFDGGSLDCGNGLLLLIRKHIDPMRPGELLEIRSLESSVEEDLPAWCRLTGNELVSLVKREKSRSFLVSKGKLQPELAARKQNTRVVSPALSVVPVRIPDILPEPSPAPVVPPLAVMGIGSWPRPAWLLRALQDRFEDRLSEPEFQSTADDAVRLCVEAQDRAGVDVITDGEQRRDNYSSFIGGLLDNCQLIPLTDLLPLVDDPAKFEKQMQSLDVPAAKVRHPAVFGPLGRSRPIAVHELEFTRTLTHKPVKIALPGPYLLARTMWMECISDRAYANREALAADIVRVLREELHFLLARGAALVQFDEPVLTEVVHGSPVKSRSFMCGALSEKKSPAYELGFALDLVRSVVSGLPRERVAVHLCRGNWTPDESAALSGDYAPLLPLLRQLPVGILFLELCTERAGNIAILKKLPENVRVGVGVVNPKHARVESVEEITAQADDAVRLFGPRRVLLTPDCGFATFADNPLSSAAVAEAKLKNIAAASRALHAKHHV